MRLSAHLITALMAFPVVSAFTVVAPRIASGSGRAVHISSRVIEPFRPCCRTGIQLYSSASETDDVQSSSNEIDLAEQELQVVKDIWTRHKESSASLEDLVTEALPAMHPALVLKLRQVEGGVSSSSLEEVNQVAKALATVLFQRLEGAGEVLKDLLNCGEIRKLDSAIGKAARQGKLDMAFFTVLNMLQDAQQEEQQSESGEDAEGANRAQILQHIYTRCQEEIEKMVPPGVALLNKLLRTEEDAIRKNQLEHYLCPQKNIITSPDGKEIELDPRPVLVPPSELISAMAQAVKQIRTVEKAGGTDPVSAARMVESCREVAKEARFVIGNNYGRDSDELRKFEEGLQPVFRPSTPDSVYIKGE